MDRKPIAEWLRGTRLAQTMPGTRRAWTQDYLLTQMRAEGWAPHRPNYSKYETGHATPEPETLDRFVAFWAARGVPGPDLSEPPQATESGDALVAALMAQTAAINALVELLAGADLPARVAALELVVGPLAERVLEGSPEPVLPRESVG